MFANFEELDGGLISRGDDHTYRWVDKGTVRIKMYDGTMRELKEVRYILSMTNNIISVGVWKQRALEGLLEKTFSRCLAAHWLF